MYAWYIRSFLIGIVLSFLHVNMSGYQNLTRVHDYSQYMTVHSLIKCSGYLLHAQQRTKYSDSSLQAVSLYVELIIMQAPKL